MKQQAERYHNKGLGRIEYKAYSDVYNCMYRVFKSIDGREILVIKHDRDFDESLLELLGRGPFNRVYESKGQKFNDYAAHGMYGWSLKEVVAHELEQIEAGRM